MKFSLSEKAGAEMRLKKIDKESITRSRTTLNMITQIPQKVGEELGYDWVIDSNGSSSSQMPLILYVRDVTDITEEVLKLVNKDAPEGWEPSKEKKEKKDSE